MYEIECLVLDFEKELVSNCDRYRSLFLEYSPERWNMGGGQCVFSYSGDSGETGLYLIDDEKYGISVRFSEINKSNRMRSAHYSVGIYEKINIIEDVGDDVFVPVGSFTDPKEAWMAVEDFFANPFVKSARITWIDSNELNWDGVW